MVVTAVTRLYRVYGPGVCMVSASYTITLRTRTVYTCTNRDASLAHIYRTRSKVRRIVFVHEKYVIMYVYINILASSQHTHAII